MVPRGRIHSGQVECQRKLAAAGAQAGPKHVATQSHEVRHFRSNAVALVDDLAIAVLEAIRVLVFEPDLDGPVAGHVEVRCAGRFGEATNAVQRQ